MDRLAVAPSRSRRVIARAPLRISFAGGGTDIMPYAGEFGGCVLSAAVDTYVYASVRRRTGGADIPTALGPRRDGGAAFDIAHDLLGLRRDADQECHIHSGGLTGSGLGSSSAAIVAIVAALGSWYDRAISPAELARLAYRIEREELRQVGGAQDHYAAAFGGLNFIEFGAAGAGRVTPVTMPPGTARQLERSLLLCDTGVRRVSSEILRHQVTDVAHQDPTSLAALHRMKSLAVQMRDQLAAGDLARFAELMGHAWEEKRRLPGVTGNPRVRRLLAVALAAGATAGRVLGAGGGGFLLFFVPPQLRTAVSNALERSGGRTHAMSFTGTGATAGGPGMREPA